MSSNLSKMMLNALPEPTREQKAVHTRQEAYLYLITHRVAFGMEKRRAYLARLMRILEKWYPEDEVFSGWWKIRKVIT